MGATLLLSVIIVGVCVLLLGVRIFFVKGGKFPESDVGKNKELRKRGLICPKEEEMIYLRKMGRKKGCTSLDCNTCGVSCENKKEEK